MSPHVAVALIATRGLLGAVAVASFAATGHPWIALACFAVALLFATVERVS